MIKVTRELWKTSQNKLFHGDQEVWNTKWKAFCFTCLWKVHSELGKSQDTRANLSLMFLAMCILVRCDDLRSKCISVSWITVNLKQHALVWMFPKHSCLCQSIRSHMRHVYRLDERANTNRVRISFYFTLNGLTDGASTCCAKKCVLLCKQTCFSLNSLPVISL